jgi:hypothetical protein
VLACWKHVQHKVLPDSGPGPDDRNGAGRCCYVGASRLAPLLHRAHQLKILTGALLIAEEASGLDQSQQPHVDIRDYFYFELILIGEATWLSGPGGNPSFAQTGTRPTTMQHSLQYSFDL